MDAPRLLERGGVDPARTLRREEQHLRALSEPHELPALPDRHQRGLSIEDGCIGLMRHHGDARLPLLLDCVQRFGKVGVQSPAPIAEWVVLQQDPVRPCLGNRLGQVPNASRLQRGKDVVHADIGDRMRGGRACQHCDLSRPSKFCGQKGRVVPDAVDLWGERRCDDMDFHD